MHGRQIELYSRFSMALVAVCVAVHAWQADPVAGRSAAVAQGADPDKKPAGDSKKTADKPDASADDTNKLYQVPDTKSSAELLRFIERINEYKPENFEEAIAHQKRASQAVKVAAERILKFEKDKSSDAYRTAEFLVLAVRVGAINDAAPAEQRALVDEVLKPLSGGELTRDDYSMVMMLSRQLENMDDTKLAAESFLKIGKAFKANKDKKIAEVGADFEGAARRVDLVGKPMQIDGRTIEGKVFDWKAYQGKVVLIDFWATWCGPCRAELPNIRRAYDEYHSRGFDVVGVSIDDDPQDVKRFLAEDRLPWVTLLDQDSKTPDRHPLADYYGYMGRIPRTMLVGKDGKVVTLNARGDELWDQLSKLLGPPAKDKAAAEVPAAKSTAAAKPATPAKPVLGSKGAAK